MASTEYGEGLIPFLESQGLVNVRRLRQLENHFKAHEQAAVDRWILVKESELRDESLSISRKALFISKIAIALSATAIISSIVIRLFAK